MSGYAYITIKCDPDVRRIVMIIARAAVRQTKCYEHVWEESVSLTEFTLYVSGTDKQLGEARKSVRRLGRGKPRFAMRMEAWIQGEAIIELR